MGVYEPLVAAKENVDEVLRQYGEAYGKVKAEYDAEADALKEKYEKKLRIVKDDHDLLVTIAKSHLAAVIEEDAERLRLECRIANDQQKYGMWSAAIAEAWKSYNTYPVHARFWGRELRFHR